MNTALVFLLDQYADWEGAYITSTLNQKADWQVKTVSTQSKVTSIGGFTTEVDYLLAEMPQQAALFLMIGGNSWTIENERLCAAVKQFLTTGVPVGAICGAVDYLARTGLLTGYRHTGNSQQLWQNFAAYRNRTDFLAQQAVQDKNLITANGTAPIEFTELLLQAVQFESPEMIAKMSYLYRFGYYNYCAKYGDPYAE